MSLKAVEKERLYVAKDQVLVMEDESKEEERRTDAGVVLPAGSETGNWHEGVVVASGVEGVEVGDDVFWGGDPFRFKFRGEEYVSLMDFEVRAIAR